MTALITVFIVVLTICIFAAYHKDVDTAETEQSTQKPKAAKRAVKRKS